MTRNEKISVLSKSGFIDSQVDVQELPDGDLDKLISIVNRKKSGALSGADISAISAIAAQQQKRKAHGNKPQSRARGRFDSAPTAVSAQKQKTKARGRFV